MTALLEYQTRLAGSMQGGDREFALPLFQGSGTRRHLGLKVYANNLMHALVSALRDTFPVMNATLGDDTFTALAVAYARANPPVRDVLLIWYGGDFPRFINATGVADAPWLADLARLEWAWLEAYHASEAAPLPPAAFARLTPEQLVAARIRLHPSVRLLRCARDIEPIWRRNRGGFDATAGGDHGDRSFRLAVMRPFAEVVVRRLSAPVFDCLVRLGEGAAFGEAAGGLAEAGHVAELRAVIAAGPFIDIETKI